MCVNGPDVLPDSRLRDAKGVVEIRHPQWGESAVACEPIFCANCGTAGGFVPVGEHNFAFYLCPPCHEKHGTPAGAYAMPDELFWAKVNAAQVEKYGRTLKPHEMAEALKDPQHMLSKLAKDRKG